MNSSKIITRLTLFFLVCSPLWGQVNSYLRIEEVVSFTLQKSQEVKISETKIQEAKGILRSANYPFNLGIKGSTLREFNITPDYINLQNQFLSPDMAQSQTNELFSYTMEFNKKLKFGTFISTGFSLFNYGRDSVYYKFQDAGFSGFIPGRSNVYLNFSQPLLLGFGKSFNTFDLIMAGKNYRITELSYYQDVSNSVFQSIQAYLNYIFATKILEIQNETEIRYETLIEQLSLLASRDALPKADLVLVKAINASHKSSKKEAEFHVHREKINLGLRLGLNEMELESLPPPPGNFFINSISKPNTADYLEKCYEESIRKRFDLLLVQQQIDAMDLEVSYLSKSLKPELNLTLGLGYNGISAAQGLAQLYQPFYSNIKGMNYFAGISYVIKPKRDKEKGELIQSMAIREREIIGKELLLAELRSDISQLYEQILTFNEVVNNNGIALDFHKEALDNEYIKLRLGTSTVINLLQLQINYNNALKEYYLALLNLNLSMIIFRNYTGSLITIESGLTIVVNYLDLFQLPYF